MINVFINLDFVFSIVFLEKCFVFYGVLLISKVYFSVFVLNLFIKLIGFSVFFLFLDIFCFFLFKICFSDNICLYGIFFVYSVDIVNKL